jgi:hypothetical protein
MSLKKITKHALHGSLLVQFKYKDMSDKTISSNTQTYQQIDKLDITPLYEDSLMETSVSGSIEDNSNNNSTAQDCALALFVNGTNEYEVGNLMGNGFAGDNYETHSGRNDRLGGNRRHATFIQHRISVGFVHVQVYGGLNKQEHSILIRSEDNNSRTFIFREGFMIVKEISAGLDNLSGEQ